jgi:hypothetical protein
MHPHRSAGDDSEVLQILILSPSKDEERSANAGEQVRGPAKATNAVSLGERPGEDARKSDAILMVRLAHHEEVGIAATHQGRVDGAQGSPA